VPPASDRDWTFYLLTLLDLQLLFLELQPLGLYMGVVSGQNVMVDAPHTGADVRAEPFPATQGSSFGSLLYVGATRPI
jgi:hypothetical protein